MAERSIRAKAPERAERRPRGSVELIAIGASAGGTEAILELISALPANMPPIIVVQHIARGFSDAFATRIDKKSLLSVKVAKHGWRASGGAVYLAPDAAHLLVKKEEAGAYTLLCEAGARVSGHIPSIDRLFESVAREAGERAIGVILTGMGRDGAAGLFKMRAAGAFTIGQDEESSAIYGMPRAAYEAGAVAKQLPLDKIGAEIIKRVGKSRVQPEPD